MQLIYDNIVASMIGAMVLLIMVAANHQTRLASAEATSYYMLQQQMLNFTATVQRDMQNVSSVNMVAEEDSVFSFRAQVTPADTSKRLIEYRRQVTGTRHDDEGNLVTLYQIVRFVDGNAAGGSIATITDWIVQVLNEEGNAATDVADARQVAVAVGATMPIEVKALRGQTVDATEWQATFRPTLLRDNTL